MSPSSELAARLEAEASRALDQICPRQEGQDFATTQMVPASIEARIRQRAADLRAAAAAVRLVGECREALIGWCSERKREQALASIADWEARNAKT